MSKTLYITKQKRNQLKEQGIDLSDYGNAGPYPCVSGMKQKYWGKDAFCVRSGAYIYNVPVDVYEMCK